MMSDNDKPDPGSLINTLEKHIPREVLQSPAVKTILAVIPHGLESGLKSNLDDEIIQSFIDSIVDKLSPFSKADPYVRQLLEVTRIAFLREPDTKDDNSFLEMLSELVGLGAVPMPKEVRQTTDDLVALANSMVARGVRNTSEWKSIEALIRLGVKKVLTDKIVESVIYCISTRVPESLQTVFNGLKSKLRGNGTKRISVAIKDLDNGGVTHLVVISNNDGGTTNLQALTVKRLQNEIRMQILAAPQTFGLFLEDMKSAIVEGTFQEHGIFDGTLLRMREIKPSDEGATGSTDRSPASIDRGAITEPAAPELPAPKPVAEAPKPVAKKAPAKPAFSFFAPAPKPAPKPAPVPAPQPVAKIGTEAPPTGGTEPAPAGTVEVGLHIISPTVDDAVNEGTKFDYDMVVAKERSLKSQPTKRRRDTSEQAERPTKKQIEGGVGTLVLSDDNGSKPSWREEEGRYILSSDSSVYVARGVYIGLFDHQKKGVLRIVTDFSSGRGGLLLGDDVGMGKTRTTVLSALILMKARKLRRVIVSCPAKVEKNWVSEAEHMRRELGMTNLVIHHFRHRSAETRQKNWNELKKKLRRNNDPIFVVSSLDLVKRDNKSNPLHAPPDSRFDLIIQDEAHHARNDGMLRTALRKTKFAGGAFLLLLTATPLQNSVTDLCSLLDTASGSKIFSGWYRNSRATILKGCQNTSTEYEKKEKDELLKELTVLAAPFVLQRSKIGILANLPNLTRSVIFVGLSPKQEEADREITGRYNDPSVETEFHVMELIRRRQGVSVHPFFNTALKDAPEKLEEYLKSASVEEILRDSPKLNACVALAGLMVAGNHKTIIFCEKIGPLKFVEKALREKRIEYVSVYGNCNRDGIISDFNKPESSIRVMLATTGKLGEGVNLQGADRAIVLTPMWNPFKETQAIGRLHRIGQEKPVEVFHLVTEKSVEISVIGKQINKIADQKDALEKTGGLQRMLQGITLREMLSKDIDPAVSDEVNACFPLSEKIEQFESLLETKVIQSRSCIRKYDIYKHCDYLHDDACLSIDDLEVEDEAAEDESDAAGEAEET